MNKKMMAHPIPRNRDMAHPMKASKKKRLTKLLVIVAALGLLLSTAAAALGGSGYTSWHETVRTQYGNCDLFYQQYPPGTKSMEHMIGPGYATVYANQGLIPAFGAWIGIRNLNPPWDQGERKVLIPLYDQVHLVWPGGTFVTATPRKSYCRDVINARYKADGRTAISMFDVEQKGLGWEDPDLR